MGVSEEVRGPPARAPTASRAVATAPTTVKTAMMTSPPTNSRRRRYTVRRRSTADRRCAVPATCERRPSTRRNGGRDGVPWRGLPPVVGYAIAAMSLLPRRPRSLDNLQRTGVRAIDPTTNTRSRQVEIERVFAPRGTAVYRERTFALTERDRPRHI